MGDVERGAGRSSGSSVVTVSDREGTALRPGDDRKRRTYLIAAGAALPSLPLVAVVQRDREVGAVPMYAFLTAFLAAVCVGLATRRLSVMVAERAVLTLLPTLIIGRLVVSWLHPDVGLAELRTVVTETAGPTLVAVILLAFLAFDTPVARRWSLAVWGAFTLGLAPAVLAESTREPSAAVALLRQSLTLLVVAVMAGFLASLKGDLAAERARAEASERLARTDTLTGALNRRGGERAMADGLAQVARYGGALTVAVVDIDRFKQRNDHLGHAAGDRALCAVVDAIRGQLRETDRVARWGGDELLVVLPRTDDTEAAASAVRWRQRIGRLRLSAGEGQHLTVSVGLAQAGPMDEVEAVVQRADHAMYLAKRAGGDRVVRAPRPQPPHLVTEPIEGEVV